MNRLKFALFAVLFACLSCLNVSANNTDPSIDNQDKCIKISKIKGPAMLFGKNQKEVENILGPVGQITKNACSFGKVYKDKKVNLLGDKYEYITQNSYEISYVSLCYYNNRVIGGQLAYKRKDISFEIFIQAADTDFIDSLVEKELPAGSNNDQEDAGVEI